MTWQAMTWAFESSVPNPAKAVLVALANWADQDESCSPSIERIAKVASISPELVQLELNHLQKTGMIKVLPNHSDQGGALGVRYYLQVGVSYAPPPASESPRPLRADEPQTSVDLGIGTFRKAWVRDRRIVGNPLSLYLYLLSYEPGVPITVERACAELGLTAEALSAAQQSLEAAGYMRTVEVAHPVDTADANGTLTSGAVQRYAFELLEPELGSTQSAHAEHDIEDPEDTTPHAARSGS